MKTAEEILESKSSDIVMDSENSTIAEAPAFLGVNLNRVLVNIKGIIDLVLALVQRADKGNREHHQKGFQKPSTAEFFLKQKPLNSLNRHPIHYKDAYYLWPFAPRRTASESACASSPSASANVRAAGPILASDAPSQAV